jgi:hypothetical protein
VSVIDGVKVDEFIIGPNGQWPWQLADGSDQRITL